VVLITNDVHEGILLADRIIPLTHGPDATLGPAVPVELPRPRDRKAINQDPRFKQTRHQVLADAMHRRPAELSQGMRQRVGIARAFALAPKMSLLDEPFGMLDSLTRFELQKVLLDLWGRDQKTAFMVTHDVDEALYLADRVVMMTNGPEAEVGEILNVHFPRPRDRKEIMDHPDYYRLREHLITFLEERAEKKPGIAPDTPPPVTERIIDLAPRRYEGRDGSNPTSASLHGHPKRQKAIGSGATRELNSDAGAPLNAKLDRLTIDLDLEVSTHLLGTIRPTSVPGNSQAKDVGITLCGTRAHRDDE